LGDKVKAELLQFPKTGAATGPTSFCCSWFYKNYSNPLLLSNCYSRAGIYKVTTLKDRKINKKVGKHTGFVHAKTPVLAGALSNSFVDLLS
jgi:hypothetical protein